MDGRTVLQDSYVVTINSLDWKVAGMADFNGDGRTEVLWINEHLSGPPGNIALWELDGAVLVNGYPFATYDPQYEIQRTGDLTGDGRADIVWRHKQTGALRLWEMRGRTVVSDRPFGYIAGDLAWQMQSTAGDYNGDGREELLWRNVSPGNPYTGSAAMWELRDGTTLVNGLPFGTLPLSWTVLATDIGRENVHGSAGGREEVSLMAKKQWWSPVTDAPPFWTVSAQPGPPAFRPAPQNGPPDWAPAVDPHTADPLPPASMEPWWVPAPPEEEDAGAFAETTRTTLWARLLSKRERVPVSLAIESEPLVTAMPATPLAAVGSRRYSFYTPELQLMAETERSTATRPNVAYEYIWFGGQPLAQIETTTGTVHWYFNDHLGTPILTTNASAAVDWRVERDPYGNVHTLRTGPTRHQPLAFPGQEDDGSDLSYNIFRWYRGGWDRYTQVDPYDARPPAARLIGASTERGQGQIGANSTYGYALGNPLSFTDPFGLFAVANCGCKPVLASGNPGAGQGGGEQMFFAIPADCKVYGASNPVPGTGNPGVTDVDFLYTASFVKHKIPGNDWMPTIYIYSDCKNGWVYSLFPPQWPEDVGCCGCDQK